MKRFLSSKYQLISYPLWAEYIKCFFFNFVLFCPKLFQFQCLQFTLLDLWFIFLQTRERRELSCDSQLHSDITYSFQCLDIYILGRRIYWAVMTCSVGEFNHQWLLSWIFYILGSIFYVCLNESLLQLKLFIIHHQPVNHQKIKLLKYFHKSYSLAWSI